jgi:hypothetical protein
VFREEKYVFLPFRPKESAVLNIWAIAVADQREVGSLYSSLEQVRTNAPGAVISEKTSIVLTKD